MSETPESEVYVEGYKAGYAKGFGEGEAAGYSDAKHRVYLSLNAMKDAGAAPHSCKLLEDAVVRLVGKP